MKIRAFLALPFFFVGGVCAAGAQGARGVVPEYFGQGIHRCSGRGLLAQGFSGYLKDGSSIRFVGELISERRSYFVYYYFFENEETHRGHHRVLIMKPGCRYAGSYIIDYARFRTSGEDIVFDVPSGEGNIIRFADGLPPKRAWVDGANLALVR